MRTEHLANDAVPETAPGPEYIHRQRVQVAEGTAVLTRGLRPGLGVEVDLGIREVATRIRFLDSNGQPFAPRYGYLHHRNETPVRVTDPWLWVHAGRARGAWALGVRAGLTVPLGRTEPDPFALGDAGLPHEHLQFGTGTLDPLAGVAVSRRAGTTTLTAFGIGRFTVAQNSHGYRAGDRMSGGVVAARRVRAPWGASAGVEVAHEAAERWHGVVRPDEGNLGRTDILAAATVTRVLKRGAVGFSARVPLLIRARGSQLTYPVILGVTWSR